MRASAAGEGLRPRSSSFARINESIFVAGHALSLIFGEGISCAGWNDHHRRPVSMSMPLSGAAGKLAELGVKTIINLRGEVDVTRVEQKEAEAAGLKYFSVEMPGLSAPSDDQVARVMAIINNPENQPVFIHCKRGADRTGTITAIYRIANEGWSAERAIAEARLRGMSWAEFGMRGYIADYYKLKLRNRNQSTAASTATR